MAVMADKTFRMSKATKTRIALGKFHTTDSRHSFKRAMIDAQLSAESSRRAALKSKDRSGKDSE